MGGKHLKKLRAEKSKVHLKKKKLSKGENLTSTSFTVKKILAVEQLKKVDKDEPVSNWNIPLKDLLTRLNHYNFTSRLNSMTGIKELLAKYPEILGGPSLKLLISRLLELVTDEEHKIRITAIDLLSYLFDLIPRSSIIPFEKLLNLHLGCAMTHRNACIQQDSLKLIDVMIKFSPEAIKCNFKSIIQNFIRIMKTSFYESHAGIFSSGKSKQDLEQGKREMLLRFYQFIVTGYPRISENEKVHTDNNNINVLMRQRGSLRDLRDQYKKIPDLSIFKNSQKKEIFTCDFNSIEFRSLCSMVIPLLFDTWIEFSPHQGLDQGPGCTLPESAAKLLSILLKIFLFLYDMAGTLQDSEVEHWFISSYSTAFKKSFTYNFPYLPAASTTMSKCSNSSECPEGFNVYMLQNLNICYLAYSLKVVEKNGQLETKMENYVSGAMKVMMTNEETEILLRVIKVGILASKHKKSNILCNAVASHDTTCNPEFRQGLLEILMNVAVENDGNEDQSITNWMYSLPDRLCQLQVFIEEIETVLKLITKSIGAELLSEIEFKAEEILRNLQNIKIQGAGQLEGQKMIADILYRCRGEVLREIMKKKILDGQMYHPDLKRYISDIFSQKFTSHFEFCEI